MIINRIGKLHKLIVFYALFALLFSCSAKTRNTFKLARNEGLVYRAEVISQDPYREEVVVFSSSMKNEICKLSGHVNKSYQDADHASPRWLILKIASYEPAESPEAIQLWFIDGSTGEYKKLLSSTFLVFSVDNTGNVICVEDLHYDAQNGRTPVITLYETKTMRVLKQVRYDQYKGTSVSANNMTYSAGKFTFVLSDNGDNYSKESISVQ